MKISFHPLPCIILFVSTAHAGEWKPRPPANRKLEPEKIMEIPVHRQLQTLLRFPEPVRLISGENLTPGDRAGLLQFQQAETDLKLVTVKPLSDRPVLMNTVMGEHALVFRLVPSNQPATVVNLLAPGNGRAVELTRQQVESRTRELGEEEREYLVRLAREEKFLKSVLPDIYQDAFSRTAAYASTRGNLNGRVTKIMRFPERDVTILLGTIENTGPETVGIDTGSLWIQIGPKSVFRPSHLALDTRRLGSGRKVRFNAVLVGEKGAIPKAVSVENEFRLLFSP